MNRLQIAQLRRRAVLPRQILLCRCRHAQRAEPVVPRKVEVFQRREPRWAIDQADDPLTPAVGPSIIDGTGRSVRLGREEFASL